MQSYIEGIVAATIFTKSCTVIAPQVHILICELALGIMRGGSTAAMDLVGVHIHCYK